MSAITLATFLAGFIRLTISLPDGVAHLAPGYCIPAAEAPPAYLDTDFAKVSRDSAISNCELAFKAARIELH